MKYTVLLLLISFSLKSFSQNEEHYIPRNEFSASMYLNPMFVKSRGNNPGPILFNPKGGYSGKITYSRYFKLAPYNYLKVGLGGGSETNTYVLENIYEKGLRQSLGTWYASIPIYYEHFWAARPETGSYFTTGIGVETNFYFTDGGLVGDSDEAGERYYMIVNEADQSAQYIPTLSLGGVRTFENNNCIAIALVKRFNTSYNPFYGSYSVSNSNGIRETGIAYTTINQLTLKLSYLFSKF